MAPATGWRDPAGPEVDSAGARRIVDVALAEREEMWLDAGATRDLLTAYGIPVVPERIARSAEEAVEAAHELGLPAVLKTPAAGAHKTEQGGVALDLRDEPQVRAAAERIGLPVLVQPMVSGGAELLAGIVQDPVFGPLVAFGPGGVFAELIGDAAFRIAPLTDVDAQELVHEGKAGRLVAWVPRRSCGGLLLRWSTSCIGSRCSRRTSPRSPSSTSTPSSRSRTAASPSTHAYESRSGRPARL